MAAESETKTHNFLFIAMVLNPTTQKPRIKYQRKGVTNPVGKKGKVVFIVTNTNNKTYITEK
jgi:hypothetical protein